MSYGEQNIALVCGTHSDGILVVLNLASGRWFYVSVDRRFHHDVFFCSYSHIVFWTSVFLPRIGTDVHVSSTFPSPFTSYFSYSFHRAPPLPAVSRIILTQKSRPSPLRFSFTFEHSTAIMYTHYNFLWSMIITATGCIWNNATQ
jgi:hypothetical protein